MFQAIYKLFEYILKTNVEEIKYISLYSNQFNRENESDRISYPAAFLEIVPLETTQWLDSVQYSTVTVRLHIVSEFYTTFKDSDKLLDKSFEHLALLDKIYLMFNEKNDLDIPEEFYNNSYITIGKMVRTGVDLSRDFGIKKDSIINFQFFLTDNSASAEKTYVEFTSQDDIAVNQITV